MNPVTEIIRRDLTAALPIADAFDILESMVREKVKTDEAGNVSVEWSNIDGSPSSIAEYVAELKRMKPTLFQNTAPTVIPDYVAANRAINQGVAPVAPASGNMTQRAVAFNAWQKSPEGQAARAVELVAEATKDGNPFSKGSVNITRQMMLTKHAPDVAAKLKREAVR